MMNQHKKLLAALLTAKVECAVIGGLACALCGWTRATVDIDVLVRHERANITRLLTCDIFVRIAGLSYDDLGADIELTTIDAGGSPLRVPHLNAQALIKIKPASVREQDRFDVAALRRIAAGERLDTPWPS